jgi:hypothetical protein
MVSTHDIVWYGTPAALAGNGLHPGHRPATSTVQDAGIVRAFSDRGNYFRVQFSVCEQPCDNQLGRGVARSVEGTTDETGRRLQRTGPNIGSRWRAQSGALGWRTWTGGRSRTLGLGGNMCLHRLLKIHWLRLIAA